jgi:hypothetical protein
MNSDINFTSSTNCFDEPTECAIGISVSTTQPTKNEDDSSNNVIVNDKLSDHLAKDDGSNNVTINDKLSDHLAEDDIADNADYSPEELRVMTTDNSDGDKKTSISKFIGDFLIAMIPSPTHLADLFSEKTVSAEIRVLICYVLLLVI